MAPVPRHRHRGPRALRALALLAAALAAAVLAAPARAADRTAEAELAARYAPVVVSPAQAAPCDRSGEPYWPVAVESVLGRPDVVLRGPDGEALAAPTAADVADRGEGWYLDFPGDPLRAGCSYERWFQDELAPGHPPTVYAHVREADGEVALQYWLFYVFNDWNNVHEGDWEMVQLHFDAPDARAALAVPPARVGFSQHTGAERSTWDDGPLERRGDRLVIYPAAGSHANFYRQRLFLGFSAEAGVGCDDTRAPAVEHAPEVVLLPDEAPTSGPFAWLSFAGLWGQPERGPNGGPTGPAMKRQWDDPVGWSEAWRGAALAWPEGTALGPTSTTVFCSGIAAGSVVFLRLLARPALVLALLVLAIALVVLLVRRTRWSPRTPDEIDRARPGGVLLRDAVAIARRRLRRLALIGAVFIPFGTLATLQQLVLLVRSPLGDLQQADGVPGLLGFGLMLLTGGPETLVPAVLTAMAVAALLDAAARGERERIDLRLLAHRLPAVAGAVGLVVLAQALLVVSVVGVPLAVVVLVWSAVAVQAAVIERLGPIAALRRSRQLVRGGFWRVLVLVLAANGLALAAGPLVGLLAVALTSAALPYVHLISSLVYVVAMPVASVATTLLFLDLRRRAQPEQAAAPAAPPVPAT